MTNGFHKEKGTPEGQQVRTNGMIKKSICRPAFLGYCSRRGKNTIAKLASRIGLVILWRSLNLKSPLRPTESALKNAPVPSVPKTVVLCDDSEDNVELTLARQCIACSSWLSNLRINASRLVTDCD